MAEPMVRCYGGYVLKLCIWGEKCWQLKTRIGPPHDQSAIAVCPHGTPHHFR